MDRVRIYIDGSNLYKSAREATGSGKVRINSMCRYLAAGRPLVQVKYFCVDPPEPNRSRFNIKAKEGLDKYREAAILYTKQHAWLNQLAQWKKIEIIRGRLQRTKKGELKEKGVDVALAVHLIVDAANNDFETAIVISGDSDFVFPIQTVIHWGKKVEAAAFQPCYHIAQTCEKFKFTEWNYKTISPFLKK